MEKTHSFKDLIVWQKAHQLVISIYKATKLFPKEEVFSLTNQVRRAAVSIAANICEGYKKKTIPNQLNFLNIAEGSLEEVKYYIILSKDWQYINEKDYKQLTNSAEEVGRLINGYEKAISKRLTT
ncbi:MAG: four helix bundle protein [Bacteroidales bacterium]|nr:four helix bundle protein [Bacteroidales bacterium]